MYAILSSYAPSDDRMRDFETVASFTTSFRQRLAIR